MSSISSPPPDIRFEGGEIPVEILDKPVGRRGTKWPCKIIATGEIKEIVVGRLCYMPRSMKRAVPSISRCANYNGPLQCKIKGKCPFHYNASIRRCSDAILSQEQSTEPNKP